MYQRKPPDHISATSFQNLSELFGTDYDRERWLLQLRRLFPNIKVLTNPKEIPDNDSERFVWLGSVSTSDEKKLGIYEVT